MLRQGHAGACLLPAARLLPFSILVACASAPAREGAASGADTSGAAAAAGEARQPSAGPKAPPAKVSAPAARPRDLEAAAAGASDRVYPGFSPETFSTEPLALLPAVRISVPPELAAGPQGEELLQELNGILLDRLPEEIRILHTRAPVYGFRDWSGSEVVEPRTGFLRSVLDWDGNPGPVGELPEIVGNSVEELGDSRGIRFFLFPRSLTILKRNTFDYFATVEAFLLDARGERAVWAGSGYATGSLPEDNPDQILSGVVRDAAIGAAADLAARLPGSQVAGGEAGFSDVGQ